MSSESHDPNSNLDYARHPSVAEAHNSVRREKDEPKAGLEPVSMWASICAGVVLVAGGSYLGAYNGGFNMNSPHAVANYTPAERPALDGAEVIVEQGPWIDKWVKDGRSAYGTCAACHGADGLGDGNKYPPLADSEWTTQGTDKFAAILLSGITGPITVKGKTYAVEPMPAQGGIYTDKQLAQIMTYIRRSFGNLEIVGEEDSIVTTEMFKAARDKYKSRTTPWTEAELLEIGAHAMLPGAKIDPLTGEPPVAEGEGDADAEEASAE